MITDWSEPGELNCCLSTNSSSNCARYFMTNMNGNEWMNIALLPSKADYFSKRVIY